MRMQTAGTTAASSSEPQITLGIHAAYLWSRGRPDRSKRTPAMVTRAGKQKAVIPINPLFDKVGIPRWVRSGRSNLDDVKSYPQSRRIAGPGFNRWQLGQSFTRRRSYQPRGGLKINLLLITSPLFGHVCLARLLGSLILRRPLTMTSRESSCLRRHVLSRPLATDLAQRLNELHPRILL